MKTITRSAMATAVFMALSACTTTEITSSTSSTLDAVTPDVTLNEFIDTRMASIQHEAAIGGGENIQALAQLMGEQDTAAFSHMLHINYDIIFNDLQQASELVSRIESMRAAKSI